MEDIKKIIANNLIKLRKKHNLTQNELAEKVNYSDNAVSRWERAEVTPSIETLQQISTLFNVPLSSLIEGDVLNDVKKTDKKEFRNALAKSLIFVSIIWFIAICAFVYIISIFGNNVWQIFVWAIPCTCLIMFPFNEYWGKRIYKFVVLSLFMWSLLACLYLQYLEYNMWLIFLIGIPVQVALAIWTFIKPKKK